MDPEDNGSWRAGQVITIPADPAEADALPPALKPFGAVPPLVTDINLSVDDKFLYVSCWGIGELKQYDVSDPDSPTRSARPSAASPGARAPGGAAAAGRPSADGRVSRDGKRIYLTNSLYGSWTTSSTRMASALVRQDRHRPRRGRRAEGGREVLPARR